MAPKSARAGAVAEEAESSASGSGSSDEEVPALTAGLARLSVVVLGPGPGLHAYAVLRLPGADASRGVHAGGRHAWAALERLFRGGRLFGSGALVRRYDTVQLAVDGYNLGAARCGAPTPPTIFVHR